MKLSPADRKTLMDFMIHIWITSCEFNKVSKSKAILILTEFMTQTGSPRQKAGERILQFFRESGLSSDELIEVWETLNKPG